MVPKVDCGCEGVAVPKVVEVVPKVGADWDDVEVPKLRPDWAVVTAPNPRVDWEVVAPKVDPNEGVD